MTTPHEIVNPGGLAPPRGFSHAVVATPGRTIYLGGQVGHTPEGKIVGPGLTEQFDRAAANVIAALEAAGAGPEHVVSLQIFCTDTAEYRASLHDIGVVYRNHFGAHYPAMALFEVAALLDPDAKVELVGIAVVQE